MKFYKRQNLNRGNPMDNGFATDANGMIITKSKIGMELPSGTTVQRPGGTSFPNEPLVSGTVRYNSDIQNLEVYQRGIWERIRTVRPAVITVQNLGNGNYRDTIFGPLNSTYQSSYQKSAANIMVYVDNVYQIPVTNYDVGTTPTSITERVAAPASTGTFTVQVEFVTGDPTTNIITATSGVMKVSGAGIAPGTTVASAYSARLQPPAVPATVTNYYFVFSQPTISAITSGSTFTVSYTTGYYITFTGTVPTKPVVTLLGFDGYFPTPD
jgi:hypothetical protein